MGITTDFFVKLKTDLPKIFAEQCMRTAGKALIAPSYFQTSSVKDEGLITPINTPCYTIDIRHRGMVDNFSQNHMRDIELDIKLFSDKNQTDPDSTKEYLIDLEDIIITALSGKFYRYRLLIGKIEVLFSQNYFITKKETIVGRLITLRVFLANGG